MMGVRTRPFGRTPCGADALLFELTLGGQFSVGISDYGAAIQSTICNDRNGRPADIALGYRDASQMKPDCGYLGSAIGRIAGRVAGASFTLGAQTHHLTLNDGVNHLHGGRPGFSHRIWRHSIPDYDRPSVTFHLSSDDGDQGYPGRIDASLTYRLEPPARLLLEFTATADQITPFNPTSHAYFNLDGHDAGSIFDHELQLLAKRRAPTDSAMIPTGEIEDVTGTSFDFSQPRQIASQPIERGGGFDQSFIADSPAGKVRPVAILKSHKTGRQLTVETDRPCIHLYTGGFLDIADAKGGARYGPASGLSLEAQGFPNSVNQPNFPADFVSPENGHRSHIIFSFTAETSS